MVWAVKGFFHLALLIRAALSALLCNVFVPRVCLIFSAVVCIECMQIICAAD